MEASVGAPKEQTNDLFKYQLICFQVTDFYLPLGKLSLKRKYYYQTNSMSLHKSLNGMHVCKLL